MQALKPRPSSLPNLALCPRWVPRPKSEAGEKDEMDEAADEGTLVHDKMEMLATVPVLDWDATIDADPDLGPGLAPIAHEAADQVRDIFSLGLPVITRAMLGMGKDDHYELGTLVLNVDDAEAAGVLDLYAGAPLCFPLRRGLIPIADGIYIECGLDSGIAMPGTGDVVMIQGTRGIYADYKTNRVARNHRAQYLAYVLGMFRAVSRLETVEARIVAPRLIGVHEPEHFTRDQIPGLEAELNAIISKAADPFTPGCPGEPCATCAGNGRCPYQAATLRDIPVQVEALVDPQAWRAMFEAVTPELRGQRRLVLSWLEKFVKTAKEDDKDWALQNPDSDIPGFTKSVGLGRASLDKTRYGEANRDLRVRFGIAPETLEAYCEPDVDSIVDYIALNRGITKDAAKTEVRQALAPYQKRGAAIVSFRPTKKTKALLGLGEGEE